MYSLFVVSEADKKKEEDVTAIVMRMQAGRLNDQRAHLPTNSNSGSKN